MVKGALGRLFSSFVRALEFAWTYCQLRSQVEAERTLLQCLNKVYAPLARELIEHSSSGTRSSFYRSAITDGREGKMAPSSLRLIDAVDLWLI